MILNNIDTWRGVGVLFPQWGVGIRMRLIGLIKNWRRVLQLVLGLGRTHASVFVDSSLDQ